MNEEIKVHPIKSCKDFGLAKGNFEELKKIGLVETEADVAKYYYHGVSHYLGAETHDIGRYAGVSSEKHLIDGYRYCMERGWEKAAQICISHAFMIQDIHTSIGKFDVSEEDYLFMKEFVATAVYDDYDRLVQLCDSLALPTGFCLLEKRFVDVTIRYGVHPATIDRWKKTFDIKASFEEQTGCSIYTLLPGVVENSFC